MSEELDMDHVRTLVAWKLEELEAIFPADRYRLSFVARYTKEDFGDADVVVLSDTLPNLLQCVEKRIAAEPTTPNHEQGGSLQTS